MSGGTIRLFMWGYQEHFVSRIRSLAEAVLERIGATPEVEVLLVGVRRPGVIGPHPICIEPENRGWPLNLFTGLDHDVEARIPTHPMTRMHYGDEASMRDRPEWIRQAVVAEQVRARLAQHDESHGVTSLVLAPAHVGGYDIAVVLQVPRTTLSAHAELKGRGWRGEEFDISFVRSCLHEVLDAAESELIRPDPGRSRRDDMRSAMEIIKRAARHFLRHATSMVEQRLIGHGPFDALNEIAALHYEGDEGLGRLLIVEKETDVEFVIQLEAPVQFSNARWVRKLLQMATAELPLLATPEHVYGLGRLTDSGGRAICVDFHGHQDWEVRWGGDLLMRTRLGEARLPQEAVPEARFRDNVARLFPESDPETHTRLWEVMCLQARQPHGSLVVIAEDAAAEAKRLAHQSTRIEPVMVSSELLMRASRIDGGLLLDPAGRCFAIGVVLDGEAREECLSSRGARYNSAVRYVYATATRRMAIVYSDDRTLDIVPLLRPRVSREKLTAALAELQIATIENYHRARFFLEEHQFYLSGEQCAVFNAAMERVFSEPMNVGELRIPQRQLKPHPDMNEGYLF